MQGILEPDSGSVVIGPTVKIGYFAQEIQLGKDMDPNQRVIDYIRDVAEYVETDEGKITAARLLERFLFRGEDQYGLIGKLSGGERRRLYLCKVLMSAPNVLILDEPTNDLDITTLTILEDYLDSFQGIVVAVSHDRYFLDRVVRRIFAFRRTEHSGRARVVTPITRHGFCMNNRRQRNLRERRQRRLNRRQESRITGKKNRARRS